MAVTPSQKFLYGLDLEGLSEIFKTEQIPAYRVKQLLEWLYQKHIAAINEAKTLPASLRTWLSENYQLNALTLEGEYGSFNRESQKFLFKTHDGHLLESVLIVQSDRVTVCVSTQLGCKMGCRFCASGKGKFLRNLAAGEIVEQIIWIEKKIAGRVTNVVFMGMGEPLDNFEETMGALKILQAPWGLGLGARRITVSTSGITPKILEFVKRSEGKVRLSVSLHSSREDLRSDLVPINKAYPLKELMAALTVIHRKLKREMTFEYTLIGGVNDTEKEALGVARLAKPLDAKVNLIPYNPIREEKFEKPSPEVIEEFRQALEKHGVRTTLRQTAGQDIHAACGQLRLDREK